VYTVTERFGFSIEPKHTEDQPKQFDREHILVFFSENFVLSVFSFFLCVSVCFRIFSFGCLTKTFKKTVKKCLTDEVFDQGGGGVKKTAA
jgi:hypothetical protein